MGKHDSSLKYNQAEFTAFLDKIIMQVEQLMLELKNKDKEIEIKTQEINKRDKQIHELEVRLARILESVENDNLQIKEEAKIEAETILEEARRNADFIINEALIQTSQKIE